MTILTVDQRVLVTVTPKDSGDAATVLDGAPEWNVDVGGVVTINAAEDGLSAWIGADGVGTVNITVSGDADLSAGERTISAEFEIQVVPGEAQTLDISFEAPEQQLAMRMKAIAPARSIE